jgi:hypothetical protein
MVKTEPVRHDHRWLTAPLLQSPNTQYRSIGGRRSGPPNGARGRINPATQIKSHRRWNRRNLEFGDDDRRQLYRRLRSRSIGKRFKIHAARIPLIGFASAIRAAVRIRAYFGNEKPIFKQANTHWRSRCREKHPEAGQQKNCHYPSHSYELSQIRGRVKASIP